MSYKQPFVKAALDSGVLRFGAFTLKSGRVSPYFFNAGDFYRADLLDALATAFAHTIDEACQAGLRFDVLFGPAYKGIPLATAALLRLAGLTPPSDLPADYYRQLRYAFDRKEAKTHGEGGTIVGSPLAGKQVLIVDDVVTAGTAKREAIAKIRAAGGTVAGIVVAVDRMEKLPGDDNQAGPSAIGEIQREYGFPVRSIVTVDDIIAGARGVASDDDIRRVEEYQKEYRATEI